MFYRSSDFREEDDNVLKGMLAGAAGGLAGAVAMSIVPTITNRLSRRTYNQKVAAQRRQVSTGRG